MSVPSSSTSPSPLEKGKERKPNEYSEDGSDKFKAKKGSDKEIGSVPRASISPEELAVDLECQLCVGLLWKPVTISCGPFSSSFTFFLLLPHSISPLLLRGASDSKVSRAYVLLRVHHSRPRPPKLLVLLWIPFLPDDLDGLQMIFMIVRYVVSESTCPRRPR